MINVYFVIILSVSNLEGEFLPFLFKETHYSTAHSP